MANNNYCINPYKCVPLYVEWVSSSSDTELKHYAEIIKDETKAIEYAYTETKDNGGYKDILDNLRDFYDEFLEEYIKTLDYANDTINNLTSSVMEYTGKDGGVFSFVNCAFIKTNLKIILKYLK